MSTESVQIENEKLFITINSNIYAEFHSRAEGLSHEQTLPSGTKVFHSPEKICRGLIISHANKILSARKALKKFHSDLKKNKPQKDTLQKICDLLEVKRSFWRNHDQPDLSKNYFFNDLKLPVSGPQKPAEANFLSSAKCLFDRTDEHNYLSLMSAANAEGWDISIKSEDFSAGMTDDKLPF